MKRIFSRVVLKSLHSVQSTSVVQPKLKWLQFILKSRRKWPEPDRTEVSLDLNFLIRRAVPSLFGRPMIWRYPSRNIAYRYLSPICGRVAMYSVSTDKSYICIMGLHKALCMEIHNFRELGGVSVQVFRVCWVKRGSERFKGFFRSLQAGLQSKVLTWIHAMFCSWPELSWTTELKSLQPEFRSWSLTWIQAWTLFNWIHAKVPEVTSIQSEFSGIDFSTTLVLSLFFFLLGGPHCFFL
jgi:hypothetical protein